MSSGALEGLGSRGEPTPGLSRFSSSVIGSLSDHVLLSPVFRFHFPATAPIPSGGWLCQMRCARLWKRRPSRSRLLPQGTTVASLLPPKSPGVGDRSSTSHASTVGWTSPVCSDRILTCRIKSIRSPAKVGLVVTDLITSPVVSWEGWETPPPPPQHRGYAVILCSTTGVVRPLCSCGDLLLSSARHCLRLVDVDWNTFSFG